MHKILIPGRTVNWISLTIVVLVAGMLVHLSQHTVAGIFLSLNTQNSPAQIPGASWLTGWKNRVRLTIEYSMIDDTLTNFPVLIRISPSSGKNKADLSFIFDELSNYESRKKIAVTTGDGISQCYVEIEKWDAVGSQAILWVKVPMISDTGNTDLFLYYDKHHPDNNDYVGDTGSIPARNVWDEDFKLVMHLGETGNGTIDEYRDSTFNGNNGTGGVRNSARIPEKGNGIAGDGQWFSGDYIEVPDTDDLSVSTEGALTISFWVSPADYNIPGYGEYVGILGKCDTAQNEWVFRIYDRDTDRPQRISFYVFNLGGGLGSGSYSEQPIQKGEWVYITGKVDNRYTYIYRNGVLANRNRYTITSGDIPAIKPQNGTSPLRIGSGNLTDWFKGFIDEVRVSGTARTDAWIKASYYAERDELIIFRTVNKPPVMEQISNKVVSAGKILAFSVNATDPDEDELVYSVSNLPPGARFNALTRTFTWTPSQDQIGTYRNIRFEVSDGSLADFEEIEITVLSENIPATGTETVSPQTSLSPSLSPGFQPRGDRIKYLYIILPVAVLVFAGSLVFIWFRFFTRRRG